MWYYDRGQGEAYARKWCTGVCAKRPAALPDTAWGEARRQAAISCLSNRSVWVLGNSVGRHWAFTLARPCNNTSRDL